jgi:transcriptional activator
VLVCARGLYSNCHNVNPNATAVGGIYGYSHTCGGYDGGQSEYVRVHGDPLRESAHRRLIELHLADGNPAAALRQYTTYQTLVRSELGVSPSPEIRNLVAPVFAGRQRV